MKIVYIAHPISGDVAENLNKICLIIRNINLTEPDILPFAHYITDCHCLNDDIPAERERGIKNDVALMRAGFINEVWLYGDRISKGMMHEIELACELNIPVIAMGEELKELLTNYHKTLK
jgi:hypothetical protein